MAIFKGDKKVADVLPNINSTTEGKFLTNDGNEQKWSSLIESFIAGDLISAASNGSLQDSGISSTEVLTESDVVNTVTSTSTTAPLSANMGKELQDEINNLQSRGRYLSQWNCVTGLPFTNPTTSPYTYKSGDYYIIGTVDNASQYSEYNSSNTYNIGDKVLYNGSYYICNTNGTTGEWDSTKWTLHTIVNYKPDGTSYTTGVASTVVETAEVNAEDTYYFDGTNWKLQINTRKTVAFANIVGQPSDNANLATALNNKENVANKTTSILNDEGGNSNTKYPTQNAVYNYIRVLYKVDTNLNSIKSAGIYHCRAGWGTSPSGTTVWGHLLVLSWSSDSAWNALQLWKGQNANIVWFRQLLDNSWGSWIRIANYSDITTALTSYRTSAAQDAIDATLVPKTDIVDNVSSTSTNQPLSANQGKLLNDRIDNLIGIGRFLSLWNCTTGLPTTQPTTLPYAYKTGDYYRISVIGEGTNYMPYGSSFDGTASTTPYSGTETLEIGDLWVYDGTYWSLSKSRVGGFVEDVTINGTSIVSSGVANITGDNLPNITLSKVSDVTATAAEVNVLDGITATTTELNYVDGVTSNIQTQFSGVQDQLNGKQNNIYVQDTQPSAFTTGDFWYQLEL